MVIEIIIPAPRKNLACLPVIETMSAVNSEVT
jgi:hypothetical protein